MEGKSLTITQLEYLLAVDKFRHFKKAAIFCHVSQPTLSMQLAKLEDELGVILFDRTKSPILPTLEGIPLIEQAKKVLKEYKRIFGLLDQENLKTQGDFTLGIIPTLAPYLLPLFVQQFSQNYPLVKLTVKELQTEEIINQIDSEELDAGLLVTPLSIDSLIERVLYYEPFYLYFSPDHPFLKFTKIKEDSLDTKDLWLLSEGHCFRNQVLNICSQRKRLNNSENARSNLIYESGSLETLKNLVNHSNGYTFLPHMAVSLLSNSEKKMIREFSGRPPTREVSIVYGRPFLKEKIIDSLEKEILSCLPREIKSLKTQKVEIIKIN